MLTLSRNPHFFKSIFPFICLFAFTAVLVNAGISSGFVFKAKGERGLRKAVKTGAEYFDEPLGTNGKSCDTCHSSGYGKTGNKIGLAGKAGLFPKYIKDIGVYTMDDQLRHCITAGEDGFPPGHNSKILKYLNFYLHFISGGYKIKIKEYRLKLK